MLHIIKLPNSLLHLNTFEIKRNKNKIKLTLKVIPKIDLVFKIGVEMIK